MAKEIRTRSELDERLRKEGKQGLYANEQARDQAKWAEKQLRLGNLNKTLPDPRKQ